MEMHGIICYQRVVQRFTGKGATMTDQITLLHGVQRIGGLLRH